MGGMGIHPWCRTSFLDSIDVVNIIRIVATGINVVELDVIVKISTDEVDGFINLNGIWEFAVGFQITSFIRGILQDYVRFRILIIPETNQDNVRLVDPDLLPELATNVAKTFHSIEAHRFQASIAQHLRNLGVFLTVFFKDQFSFQPLIFVLSPPPVLSSLSLVLRHFYVKLLFSSTIHNSRNVFSFINSQIID